MTKARDIASASPAPSTVSATELGYLDGVSSAIQTQIDGKVASSLVDAKGDLLVGSADNTLSRLAVSDNGSTLVADSSTSTGLRWSSQFLAGKNKIINGDFTINQRSFVSTTTNGTYGFDRWSMLNNGGTTTYSAQAFTAGTAPVAGYEATNFARLVTTSMTTTDAYSWLWQGIEDVRTFAGQTATISFWAKAASGTPKIAVETTQYFGTGGSPSSNIDTYHGNVTIGTTWQRYSVVASIPSLSGKTVGTNANTSMLRLQFWVSGGSAFNSRTGSIGNQNNTFDIWGVQIEAGSVATPFSTATGTLAGELAACQRYYYKSYNQSVAPGTSTYVGAKYVGAGLQGTTTANQIIGTITTPTMRTAPTVSAYDIAGTINKCTRVAPGVNEYNNESVTIDVPGESGFRIFSSTGTAASSILVHIVASAEL